jgi:hypothetical protein
MRGHSLTITTSNNGNLKKHLVEQNWLRLGKHSNINICKLINVMGTFSSPRIISSSELQASIFSVVSLIKLCAVEDVINFVSPLQSFISKDNK